MSGVGRSSHCAEGLRHCVPLPGHPRGWGWSSFSSNGKEAQNVFVPRSAVTEGQRSVEARAEAGLVLLCLCLASPFPPMGTAPAALRGARLTRAVPVALQGSLAHLQPFSSSGASLPRLTIGKGVLLACSGPRCPSQAGQCHLLLWMLLILWAGSWGIPPQGGICHKQDPRESGSV